MLNIDYILNKTSKTRKACKDLNYVIYFNYDKKDYYTNIYIRSKNN